MSHVYLIGGTPRTGKSTLTKEFIKNKPVLAATTDAIRYTIRQLLDPATNPALFAGRLHEPDQSFHGIDDTRTPEEHLDAQLIESRIVWKSVKHFIDCNIADGYDVLVEGVAIMPEFVSSLDHPVTSVFLGNTADSHLQIIAREARRNDKDWMHSFDDEAMRKYARVFQMHSAYIAQQCNEYSQTYLEMDDVHFEDSISAALEYLLPE